MDKAKVWEVEKKFNIEEEAFMKKIQRYIAVMLSVVMLCTVVLPNAVSGKSGISITVGLKYTETYLHKEGYYVYGCSPTSLSVRKY